MSALSLCGRRRRLRVLLLLGDCGDVRYQMGHLVNPRGSTSPSRAKTGKQRRKILQHGSGPSDKSHPLAIAALRPHLAPILGASSPDQPRERNLLVDMGMLSNG
jgi:hypothetical protein